MAVDRRFISQVLRLTGAPVGTGDTVMWRAPFGCRVTQIRAYRSGGTAVTVNAKVGSTNVLASTLTAGNAVFTTGSTDQTKASGVGSGKMAAGDVLSATVVASDGTTVLIQADIEVDKNEAEL